LENLIEGDLKPRSKVIIIEDLISTGGSSIKAIEAVRNAGCDVIGMLAIFTYGLSIAENKFKEAKVKLITLCNYDAVLDEALKTDYIDESEIKTLQEWRKDPANWNPK
jgi:orotate phosphoribosyltransferase